MKATFKLLAFIFLFSFFMHAPGLNANQEFPIDTEGMTISMDFQNASLKDILKIFSIQSGINFVASEAVQDRMITLYFDKVPLKEAMDKLFSANNLTYDMDSDANIFIVKDWGKPQIETITKVFYLKYATVSSSSLKEEMATNSASNNSTTGTGSTGSGSSSGSSTSNSSGKYEVEEDVGITKTVKKMLSEYGSVVEDFRTNSLIVTDIPSRMISITKTIAALDIPTPQVLLEVEMLDVSKNIVDKIGFKFGTTPFTAIITGATASTGFPFHSWSKIADAANGTIGINNGTNTYQAQLDFLRTDSDTKYLARPKILTLNNETAEIKIVTQETIGVTTQTTGGESAITQTTNVPERTETGISLRVTPQVNTDTGEITMFIVPSVKDTSTSSFISSGSGSSAVHFKDPEERTTKSTVRIKDGDTVVLGGLIRNTLNVTITKLPFLGDLPLIGGLFRHKDQEKNIERELLVFITPRIIKDSGIANMELATAKKIDAPEREQSTVSVSSRQSAINNNLNNFEKKKN